MLKIMVGLILLIGLVVCISCGTSTEEDKSFTPQDAGSSSADYGSSRTVPAPAPTTSAELASLAADRMIVRIGNLEIVVEKVTDAVEDIKKLAINLEGYVVSSSIYGGEDHDTADVAIRVPVQRYDEAMESIKDIAIEVVLETGEAKDVTEEYSDLGSQLRNLEATENRYLEILEKAETIEEILDVEHALSQTRGEIEQIKGRIQYLERTSSTSLIQVALEEKRALEADFEASTLEIEEGERVYIRDKTVGGAKPYGYSWDLGNGESSTDTNPTVVYDEAGEYTIRLTVTDSEGNSYTETKDNYITVVPKPGWSPGNIAQTAWRGLAAFGRFLGNALIWIGILAIIWVPALVIFILVRRRRRKAHHDKTR